MKFLIVDDNSSNAKLLKKLLEKYGDVDMADNGDDAIYLYTSNRSTMSPYSCIFLDIMMPQKDGYEVLKEIREWEQENLEDPSLQVQVVMATARHDTESVIKSYDNGCQHYLLKPYCKDDLQELMESIS